MKNKLQKNKILKDRVYISIIEIFLLNKGQISPSTEGNSYIIVDSIYEHWVAKFGLTKILVTDNGTEFINNEIITLCQLLNNKHKQRTNRAPWTNGLVEGRNRSLQEYLSCFFNGNDPRYIEWSSDVKLIPLSYNSQITTTLGISPYEMVFNKKPRKPIIFTANAHENTQSYCQSNEDLLFYNLLLHTHHQDHFHHSQILNLATGTHTEWISNIDKNTMKFIKN